MVEFLRGGLPLGRAFWRWGILGGGIVSLFSTLCALTLIAAGAPAWLAVLVFAAHIPWNLVLLVGVWRSAGRPGGKPRCRQSRAPPHPRLGGSAQPSLAKAAACVHETSD